jgi:hypothetical protein
MLEGLYLLGDTGTPHLMVTKNSSPLSGADTYALGNNQRVDPHLLAGGIRRLARELSSRHTRNSVVSLSFYNR